MRSFVIGVTIVALAACNKGSNVQCDQNSNCDLSGGGMCIAASTGNMWCAYPDPLCPGGYRYSDQSIGDGVSGECVPNNAVVDAGVDALSDASIDGTPLNCPATAPVQSGQAADLELGQPGFTSGGANNPFRSGSSFSVTWGLFADGTRLWVGDSGNSRVLQWNSFPGVNGQSASIAIGQADLITTTSGTAQDRLSTGGGYIAKAGTKLVVSDGPNNRVLIWNSIPTTNGQPADLVLGQTGFTTKVTGNSASSMYGPTGVWTDGTHLIVVDRFNNRVLIWNTFPTTNGAAANVVLGASAFDTSPSVNPPTASSFFNPFGVAYDGARLYIADQGNNRVLVWNGIPATNNAAAVQVLGQTGFDANFSNGGAPYPQVNAIGMNGPSSVIVDECGSLYVCDDVNGRVLVYTHAPTANAAPADAVLGKSTLTTQPNAAIAASSQWMGGCSGLAASGASLYVGDSGFHRVLRFSLSR